MKWAFLCNGGPNNTIVGGEADSLGKACGQLEAAMKALGATIGQVERLDAQRKVDSMPVDREEDAGREVEA